MDFEDTKEEAEFRARARAFLEKNKSAEGEDRLLDRGIGPRRRAMRPPGSVDQPGLTRLAEPCQPLVAGLPAHPETPAELGQLGPRLRRQRHKLQT